MTRSRAALVDEHVPHDADRRARAPRWSSDGSDLRRRRRGSPPPPRPAQSRARARLASRGPRAREYARSPCPHDRCGRPAAASTGSTASSVSRACRTRRKRTELGAELHARRPRRDVRQRARRPIAATGPKNGRGKRSLGPARRTSEPGPEREGAARARKHRELARDARHRDLAAREAKRPSAPRRPTPSCPSPPPSETRGARVELGELLGDERPHERLVDVDVCIPLGHRSNLPCQQAAPSAKLRPCTGSSSCSPSSSSSSRPSRAGSRGRGSPRPCSSLPPASSSA